MREYGSVHTRFWANVAIQSLSDQAKLFALYLLTGPHTNMLGCFRLPIGYIAEDLNWRAEVAIKKLDEISQMGFAHYDAIQHWILLPQFLTWNPIENPNQGKSIRRLFEQVPTKVNFFIDLINTVLAHDKYLEESFKENLHHLLHVEKETTLHVKQDHSNDPKNSRDPLPETLDVSIACISTETVVPIITIPLNDRSEFPIFKPQIDEWQSLYPSVDVLQTLRNIRAWNQANPSRCKTKNGILRHIVSWLSKEQNQSKSNHSNVLIREPLNSAHARNLATASHWLNESHYRNVSEINVNPSEGNA